MTNLNLTNFKSDLKNWVACKELCKRYPQFSNAQLKYLLWKRKDDPALESCCCLVGKKLYVNVPMFGLWMAGELPQQKGC